MKEKISVLFLVHKFDIGGVQKVNIQMINGIDKEKFDVHVFYLLEGPFMEDLERDEIHLNKLGNKLKLMSPVNLLYILKVVRYIKRHDIDIVHTIDPVLYVVGATAAHLASVKHIRTQPNFVRKFEKLNTRTMRILPFERWTQGFIALQEATAVDLKLAGVHPEKIDVIYGFGRHDDYILFDELTDLRQELSIPQHHKIILAMHRMVPRKGLEIFIEMIPIILKDYKDVSFLLVGDGPLRAVLESRVKELGVSENVRFTGFRKDIVNIGKQITFGVYPQAESAAMSVVLRAGKVLITRKNSAMDEYVIDGATGFLTPDDHPETYARYSLLLLRDHALLRDMEKNSAQLVESRFDGEKNIKKLQEIMYSLCRGEAIYHAE